MRSILDAEVRMQDVPDDIRHQIANDLCVDNPEYTKRARQGLWLGKTPKKLHFYRNVGDAMIVPFGYWTQHAHEWQTDVDNSAFVGRDRFSYLQMNTPLYQYQDDAVFNCFMAGNGILVAPCGSGKTQMGIALFERFSLRTLWLTHTKDLLNQSKARAEQCITGWDAYKHPIGTITEGRVDIGDCITFATVQTLANVDLYAMRNMFGVIIVDECQHCVKSARASAQFSKVLSALSAPHKFGLTATPYRADGLVVGMYALLGGIAYNVPASVTNARRVPFSCVWTRTAYDCPSDDDVFEADGTINFVRLVTDVATDANRNAIVAQVIADCPKPALVLSERIAQAESLMNSLPNLRTARIAVAQSKKAKAERGQAIDDLRNGKIDVLFATYQLAKEGLDIPALQSLVMASPVKERTTVIQSVGRVMRAYEGKTEGRVFDFIDGFGVFQRYRQIRNGIYKRMLAEINEVN